MKAQGEARGSVAAGMRRDRTGAFVGGAMVLATGSMVSRALGAVYRIVLPIVMGGGQRAALGMGLFQFAYPIFTVLVTLITTGFPLAISKLVAERLAAGDRRGADAVLRTARVVLPACALVLAVALWFLAPAVADHIAGDPQATLSIRAIAPAILTVSLASVYRGGFQGMQDMTPYAISQVLEQIARVLTMFALVIILLPVGIQWAAAGASFGATVGGATATAAIIVLWRQGGAARLAAPPGGHRNRRALENLFGLALPITTGALVLPLLNLANAAIVPIRLRAGGFGAHAMAMYGVLSGYASPLVTAPSLFTAALAMSLLPAISAAVASGDRAGGSRRAAIGLRLALLFALPASVGLILLSGPLPRLLFHSPAASRPLAVLAPTLLFLSLQQTSSGILQALGRPSLPVRHLGLGGILMVIVAWVLVARPGWNVTGAALGTTLAFAVASALNLRAAGRLLPGAVDWGGMAGRPVLATAAMAAAVLAWEWVVRGHDALAVAGGVVGGAVIYGAGLLVFGALRAEELQTLPRVGAPLAGFLLRRRLIRP